MSFVAVASQKIKLQDRRYVNLRDLLEYHLGKMNGDTAEERVANALMGVTPEVWLLPEGGVDGVARTFRLVGALDVDPHPNVDEREDMDMRKMAFVWNVPQSGLFLRYPLGVRCDGDAVSYEDFRTNVEEFRP